MIIETLLLQNIYFENVWSLFTIYNLIWPVQSSKITMLTMNFQFSDTMRRSVSLHETCGIANSSVTCQNIKVAGTWDLYKCHTASSCFPQVNGCVVLELFFSSSSSLAYLHHQHDSAIIERDLYSQSNASASGLAQFFNLKGNSLMSPAVLWAVGISQHVP